MNDYLKLGLAALGGALLGGGGAYLYARQKYEKRIQAEVDSVRDAYKALIDDEGEGELSPFEAAVEEATQPSDDPPFDVDPELTRETTATLNEKITNLKFGEQARKPVKTRYSTMIDDLEYAAKDQAAREEDPTVPIVEGRPLTQERLHEMSVAFLIEVDAYANPPRGYETATVVYYKDDDILADEDDEQVNDHVTVLGTEALTRLRDVEDMETLFVRNPRLETDFEVTQVDGSFAELILGAEPSKG